MLIKAEELLADNIDQDSDFGEHLDEHDRLKPSMPAGYPAAAAALEASPPLPVHQLQQARSFQGVPGAKPDQNISKPF